MLNLQRAEKRFPSDGTYLDVHSIFYTIQGEGPFCGYPAIFIRLAGCNLQCPKCDTDYTAGRQLMLDNAILNEVEAIRLPGNVRPIVVISGGEPFRQNIQPLMRRLVLRGYAVQVETNGTLAPMDPGFNHLFHRDYGAPREGIFVVCSPKTPTVAKGLLPHIGAYKYVLRHDSVGEDGLPNNVLGLSRTKSWQVARPHDQFRGPVYLQPCDDKDWEVNKLNEKAVIDSCMKHGYVLQLQIHKFLGVE